RADHGTRDGHRDRVRRGPRRPRGPCPLRLGQRDPALPPGGGAYALLDPLEGERGRRVRWDYGDETPLRDARGFELQRAAAHPSQLTDEVHDAHVPSVEKDMP